MVNPYDKCVANKIIDGDQCTISWHVDDNIVTYKKQSAIEYIKKLMVKHFGEMDFIEGEEHTFLGMKITVKDKKVKIDMRDQVNETIDKFELDSKEFMSRGVASPANHKLFMVDLQSEELDERRSDILHSTTAKLLYVMKRASPDIETAIFFK